MIVAQGNRVVGQLLSVETEDGKIAILTREGRKDLTPAEFEAAGFQLIAFEG